MKLSHYCATLLSEGKYYFLRSEAMRSLALNARQFQMQAYRLAKKKAILKLHNDFFIIIPAEYQALEALPPHWIIDALMKFIKQEYYIGILSAAMFYGATHQQPMRFQVITTKSLRSIELPRGGIDFYTKTAFSASQTTSINTPTGKASISTKEQTLIDLVNYYKAAGYFSNIGTVIKELAPQCKLENFALAVKDKAPQSVLQRLGYLLELTGNTKLAQIAKKELEKNIFSYRLLNPKAPKKFGKKSQKWKLIINDTVEVESTTSAF